MLYDDAFGGDGGVYAVCTKVGLEAVVITEENLPSASHHGHLCKSFRYSWLFTFLHFLHNFIHKKAYGIDT